MYVEKDETEFPIRYLQTSFMSVQLEPVRRQYQPIAEDVHIEGLSTRKSATHAVGDTADDTGHHKFHHHDLHFEGAHIRYGTLRQAYNIIYMFDSAICRSVVLTRCHPRRRCALRTRAARVAVRGRQAGDQSDPF